MSAQKTPLRAALVGCGGMGRRQAGILASLDEFELVAVCDRSSANLAAAKEQFGVPVYEDLAALMEAEKPEVIAITTPNSSHAPLTRIAAEKGARGVYCEKPMATNLEEARDMVAVCKAHGVKLVVNHQRRLGDDLVKAKQLIDSGAIGEVRVVRGHNAGDVLSDASHTVDSIQWLTGDQTPKWIFGQIHRSAPDPFADEAGTGDGSGSKDQGVAPGYRYGHVIETGGVGIYELPSGVRVEIFSGDMRAEGRIYQDYEIIGTQGQIWRTGDRPDPNLFISDAEGGPLVAVYEKGHMTLVPAADGQKGSWRSLDASRASGPDQISEGYRRFATMIHEDTDHPMSGENALRGFEILMGIYEAARTHRKMSFPIIQPQFPLKLMMAAGIFKEKAMAVACSTCAWKAPIEEAAKNVRKLGFKYIDLICIPGFGQITADQLHEDFEGRAGEIEKMLADNKLTPIAMNMAFGHLHDRTDAKAVEKRQADAQALAKLMKRLNVPLASFYPGYRAEGREWKDVLPDQVAGIRDLLDVARAEGVKFIVEPHFRTVMETLDQNRAILDAIPELQVAFDSSHFVLQSIPLEDVRFLIERAAHMHLRDAGPDKMCLPTGQGATNFDELFDLVESVGFVGHWSIEYLPDDSGTIDQSLLELKSRIDQRFN